MGAVERTLRRLESALRIDREGRSVWVWLIPVVSGILIGLLFGIMPGFPIPAGWGVRVLFGCFGLVATVAVSVICMLSFENEHNSEADPALSRSGRSEP